MNFSDFSGASPNILEKENTKKSTDLRDFDFNSERELPVAWLREGEFSSKKKRKEIKNDV